MLWFRSPHDRRKQRKTEFLNQSLHVECAVPLVRSGPSSLCRWIVHQKVSPKERQARQDFTIHLLLEYGLEVSVGGFGKAQQGSTEKDREFLDWAGSSFDGERERCEIFPVSCCLCLEDKAR